MRVKQLIISSGDVFYRLRVLCAINGYSPHTESAYKVFLCRCDCGRLVRAQEKQLLNHEKLSCGCFRIEDKDLLSVDEIKFSSGKVFRVWQRAKCANILCKRWLDVRVFYRDVGDPPSYLSCLLRKDKKKPHSKKNTYWGRNPFIKVLQGPQLQPHV